MEKDQPDSSDVPVDRIRQLMRMNVGRDVFDPDSSIRDSLR